MDQARERRLLRRLKALGVSNAEAQFAIQEANASNQRQIESLSYKLKDLTRQIKLITSGQSQIAGTAGTRQVASTDELAVIFDRMAEIRGEALDAKAALANVLEKIEGNSNNEALLTRVLEKVEENSGKEGLAELANSIANTNRTVKHTTSILSIGTGALVLSAILLVALFVWQASA